MTAAAGTTPLSPLTLQLPAQQAHSGKYNHGKLCVACPAGVARTPANCQRVIQRAN